MEKWKAKCDKCGREFWSYEAVDLVYSEHPGAPMTSIEQVSPCCHADYSEA